MKIKDFGVEMWMNAYENDCTYNLAETCVRSLTVRELLEMDETATVDEHLQAIADLQLTYGDIEGSEALREGLCTLYDHQTIENITVTHGAIGANSLALHALVDPGDIVVSVLPTYQQLYSIPESYGADVRICNLEPENGFLPSPEEIARLAEGKAKLICINNPNNPSGALMDEKLLRAIVDVARECDAWLLCDEAYRGLNHTQPGQSFAPAICDLYEKGVSTGSFSKTFSLAGLRMGWVAAPPELIELVSHRRDYTIISCGRIDDYLASVAIRNKDAILQRNLRIVNACSEALDAWVASEPHITYVKPQAGTTAFLQYDMDIESALFCANLQRDTGVMLLPGSAMECEGFLRMGYCYTEDVAELKHALGVLSAYLRTFD